MYIHMSYCHFLWICVGTDSFMWMIDYYHQSSLKDSNWFCERSPPESMVKYAGGEII